MTRRTNQSGIDIIKTSESLRLKPYMDPAGHLTIGWGHKINGGEDFLLRGITAEEADILLREDLKEREKALEESLDHPELLSSNQYSALIDFLFNVGQGNLNRSNLRKRVNAGEYAKVPRELMKWTKARDPKTGELVELPGLVTRRRVEAEQWSLPDGEG